MAERLSASIEKTIGDDGHVIEVTAPDGHEWSEGLNTLVAPYGYTWGPASDAWEDLYFRMTGGLVEQA